MKSSVITVLKKSEKAIVDFIVDRLSMRWKTTKKEIHKKYIMPSFCNSFPIIYIAKYNNEFVGMIMMLFKKEGYLEIKNQLWITALFVKNEYRSCGIGKKLVFHTKTEAKRQGYAELFLDTAEAAEYYKKIDGWEIIGKDFWDEGKKYVTIMKSRIP